MYSSVHYGEARPPGIQCLELGFHCEARDKHLNRFLLEGFRRHLFEIKAELGESVEAEMWDRGWTKIYEVLPERELTGFRSLWTHIQAISYLIAQSLA